MTTTPDNEEFHSRALYASARETGLHVGWIEGPQGSLEQKRLSFYIDFDEGPPFVFAICTGPGHLSEVVEIESNADIVRVVKEYLQREVK